MSGPESWFIGAALALCLFALAALLRRDLPRLGRPTRKVTARVTGHRTGIEDDRRHYAEIYAFSDETGRHEVTDQVLSPRPQPRLGAVVELTYPAGRPDLARPPRPWTWLLVYAALAYGTAVLVLRALGRIPA